MLGKRVIKFERLKIRSNFTCSFRRLGHLLATRKNKNGIYVASYVCHGVVVHDFIYALHFIFATGCEICYGMHQWYFAEIM